MAQNLWRANNLHPFSHSFRSFPSLPFSPFPSIHFPSFLPFPIVPGKGLKWDFCVGVIKDIAPAVLSSPLLSFLFSLRLFFASFPSLSLSSPPFLSRFDQIPSVKLPSLTPSSDSNSDSDTPDSDDIDVNEDGWQWDDGYGSM